MNLKYLFTVLFSSFSWEYGEGERVAVTTAASTTVLVWRGHHGFGATGCRRPSILLLFFSIIVDDVDFVVFIGRTYWSWGGGGDAS